MGNHSETAELLEEALSNTKASQKVTNPVMLKDDDGNSINIGEIPDNEPE